jgi:hypothetical protein
LKGLPSQGSHLNRVGEAGLCPAEPERGRVWEPSQGSHLNRVGEAGLCPAEPERGRVWEPSQGSPFRVFDSVTRGLRRGGSCQLGPAPRCALRSIQFETCSSGDSGVRLQHRRHAPSARNGSPPLLPPATPAPAGHLGTSESARILT